MKFLVFPRTLLEAFITYKCLTLNNNKVFKKLKLVYFFQNILNISKIGDILEFFVHEIMENLFIYFVYHPLNSNI